MILHHFSDLRIIQLFVVPFCDLTIRSYANAALPSFQMVVDGLQLRGRVAGISFELSSEVEALCEINSAGGG